MQIAQMRKSRTARGAKLRAGLGVKLGAGLWLCLVLGLCLVLSLALSSCATSGDKDAAREVTIQAGELADIWAELGASALELKAYDDVIVATTKALDVVPTHVRSLMLRAQAYKEKKLYSEAYDDVRAIIAQDPKPEYKRMLAEYALFANRHKEAQQILEELILANPKNKDLRYNRGLSLLEQGKAAEALEVFIELHELGDKVVSQLVDAAKAADDPRYPSYLELAVSSDQEPKRKKEYQLDLIAYYEKEKRVEDAVKLWDELFKKGYKGEDLVTMLPFGLREKPIWALDVLEKALEKKSFKADEIAKMKKLVPKSLDDAYKQSFIELLDMSEEKALLKKKEAEKRLEEARKTRDLELEMERDLEEEIELEDEVELDDESDERDSRDAGAGRASDMSADDVELDDASVGEQN